MDYGIRHTCRYFHGRITIALAVFLAVLLAASLSSSVPAPPMGGQKQPIVLSSEQQVYLLTPYAEILEDRDRAWTITDVASGSLDSRFSPLTSVSINQGITPSVFWLRFTVINRSYSASSAYSARTRAQWLLDPGAALPYRVQATLYKYVTPGKAFLQLHSGQFFQLFTDDSSVQSTYYLRLESDTGLLLKPRILTFTTYLENQSRRLSLLSLYYGLILAVILYQLLAFLSLRDRSNLYFAIHLFSLALYFLGINDMLHHSALVAHPDTLGTINRSTLAIYLVTAVLFTRSFLFSRFYAPRADRVLLALMVLAALLALANPFLPPRPVNGLLNLLGLGLSLLTIVTALLCWRRGFRAARFFLIAWSLFVLGGICFALTFAKVLPYNIWLFGSFQAGSGVAAVIFSLALGERLKSLRREKEDLQKSEVRIRTIVDSIKSGVLLIEPQTNLIVEANYEAARIIGAPRQAIVNRMKYSDIHEGRLQTLPADGGGPFRVDFEEEIVNRQGRTLTVIISDRLLVLDNKELVLESVLDITDRKRAERALQKSEKQYKDLVDNANSIILRWTLDAAVIFLNPYGLEFFGYRQEEILGRNIMETFGPAGEAARGQLRTMLSEISHNPDKFRVLESPNLKQDGTLVWVSWTNKLITDDKGRPLEILSVGNDITELKRLEGELATLAATDGLTGVDNRRRFIQCAEEELSRSRRYHYDLSFMMMDIDLFKDINDTHGHHIGDQVLKTMAEISQGVLRQVDHFGRLGGEEFGAVLAQTNLPGAVRVAERLRKKLAGHVFVTDKGALNITVSIGVSTLSGEDDTLEKIMERADQALYKAKNAGRNRVEKS